MDNIYRLDEHRRLIESRNRLRDHARERAGELREQALVDFWVGADAWVREAAHSAQRAANRLAARLRAHARHRAAASGALDA